MKKNYLEEWENATQNLSQQFIEKYFGEDNENYWISDEVGGVLFINDYFFSLNEIADFMRWKYTKNNMFKYYDYAVKCSMEDESPITIKNYLRLKCKN